MESRIHPTAIVESGAQLHDSVQIGPFCHVGAQVVLHENVTLHSHVMIRGRTAIGSGTQVHAFAVLGGPPQHLGYKGQDTKLTIGMNNIIREHVTMNIGTAEGRGETLVGDASLFMTGAHVAHDCIVGNNTVFANNATLGGHAIIEDCVFLGGLSAVHQHCYVGQHAFLGGCAAVIHDVIPYGSANGNYADLMGLNIIGLKRRGFARDTINAMRAGYKSLFEGEGAFQDRLVQTAETFKDSREVMEMITFIQKDRIRPIMMPA